MPLTIPEYITIKTAAGTVAAYLSPESDGLKDCVMDRELNGKSTLTFYLPIQKLQEIFALTVMGVMPELSVQQSKWQYLTGSFHIHAPDITGQMREFVIQNPDAIEKVRDGKKLWGKITAHESWVRLGKDYVDPGISNDPQTPDSPPLAVIILSGGSDLSGGRYPVGSAGHALYALLQGTGWSVGTVDVEGTHDLETEKISVLENINKIQEIWGGYLVWDSINKTVSLRSETTWAPYTGYQVRYAKNLKGITRTDDYDIITKLYPFGENDLNIGSVNNGQIYIEDHSYTDEVLEGIWVNQDIADPQKLKDEATKYLAKVCKPRHNYRVKHVDLRLLSGYQHEDFDLGHLVDVIDEELGANDKARIIRYRFNIFQPWKDSEIEVGDPLEKIESMLVDSREMVQYLNSIKTSRGQITAYKLVDESVIAQKIAKAAIDATRLNTKTVILLDDTWTDNTPAPGYVSWNQHKLYYAGQEYIITAGNTNLKYIYWDGSSNNYSVSATEPTLTDGQFIIAVNNDGLHDTVWDKGYAREFIGSTFIADAAIKSAHIAEAQILDAHIANVSANKITTGQILAYLVEILGQNGYFKITGDGLRVYDDVGNLKGHLGWYETLGDQLAAFTRSSVAYKQDGTQVAANHPRYEYHALSSFQGIMVEESTSNLVRTNAGADPLFNSATGWTFFGQGASIANGVLTLKSTDGTTVSDCQCTLTNLAQNTKHSFLIRARYKDTTGTAGSLHLDLQATGYDNAEQELGISTGQLTTAFQNFKKDGFDSQAVPSSVQLRIFTFSTRPIEVEFVQLEQKAYATTVMDGSRADEVMTVPTAEVFQKGNWTVKLRYTPTSAANLGDVVKYLWSLYIDANNRYEIIIGWYGDLVLKVFSGGTGYVIDTAFNYIVPGNDYYITVCGDGSKIRLFVNGAQIGTDTTYVEPVGTLPTNMYIGCAWNGTGQANGINSDFAVMSKAQTLAEHQAEYNTGLPLKVDEYITYLMSCNGTLKPTVRRFGLWLASGEIGVGATIAGNAASDLETKTGAQSKVDTHNALQSPHNLPSYTKMQSDGFKVFDNLDQLRCHLGQYAAGKYGLKVINGEIYSTLFRTGTETDTAYIELVPPNMLRVIYNNKTAIEIVSGGLTGNIAVFDNNVEYVRLTGHYSINGVSHAGLFSLNNRPLALIGPNTRITFDTTGQITASPSATDKYFFVNGKIGATGAKDSINETQNFGKRSLYAVESPNVWFVDKGIGQLTNGECKVNVDPILLEVVEKNSDSNPWIIHLTPYADIDIFVAEVGENYFVVKERNSGLSNACFAWSLSLIRRGYANVRMEEFEPEGDILTSDWEDELLP